MAIEYEAMFCSKCKHASILNIDTVSCTDCDSKLIKITIDLPGLTKENKIELLSEVEDEGEGIFVRNEEFLDEELLDD